MAVTATVSPDSHRASKPRAYSITVVLRVSGTTSAEQMSKRVVEDTKWITELMNELGFAKK